MTDLPIIENQYPVKYDKALSFDGTNDYVDCGTGTSLNINNNFTICAWIKIGTAKTQGVVHWGEASNGKRRSMFIYNGGAGTNYYAWFSGFGAAANIQGTTILAINTWYFLSVTLDSSNVAKIYVNGNLDATGNPTLIAYSYLGTVIGNTRSAEWFNGIIDNVRIYNTALSQTRIQQVMNENAPSSGLVGEWLFNEESGSTAIDTSGSSNTGTIYGATRLPVELIKLSSIPSIDVDRETFIEIMKVQDIEPIIRLRLKRRYVIAGVDTYDADWTDITEYLTTDGIGDLSAGIGNEEWLTGALSLDSMYLTFDNNTMKFNKRDDISSLWYDASTAYYIPNSIVEIHFGYKMGDKLYYNELPYLSGLIKNDSISYDTQKNNFNCMVISKLEYLKKYSIHDTTSYNKLSSGNLISMINNSYNYLEGVIPADLGITMIANSPKTNLQFNSLENISSNIYDFFVDNADKSSSIFGMNRNNEIFYTYLQNPYYESTVTGIALSGSISYYAANSSGSLLTIKDLGTKNLTLTAVRNYATTSVLAQPTDSMYNTETAMYFSLKRQENLALATPSCYYTYIDAISTTSQLTQLSGDYTIEMLLKLNGARNNYSQDLINFQNCLEYNPFSGVPSIFKLSYESSSNIKLGMNNVLFESKNMALGESQYNYLAFTSNYSGSSSFNMYLNGYKEHTFEMNQNDAYAYSMFDRWSPTNPGGTTQTAARTIGCRIKDFLAVGYGSDIMVSRINSDGSFGGQTAALTPGGTFSRIITNGEYLYTRTSSGNMRSYTLSDAGSLTSLIEDISSGPYPLFATSDALYATVIGAYSYGYGLQSYSIGGGGTLTLISSITCGRIFLTDNALTDYNNHLYTYEAYISASSITTNLYAINVDTNHTLTVVGTYTNTYVNERAESFPTSIDSPSYFDGTHIGTATRIRKFLYTTGPATVYQYYYTPFTKYEIKAGGSLSVYDTYDIEGLNDYLIPVPNGQMLGNGNLYSSGYIFRNDSNGQMERIGSIDYNARISYNTSTYYGGGRELYDSITNCIYMAASGYKVLAMKPSKFSTSDLGLTINNINSLDYTLDCLKITNRMMTDEEIKRNASRIFRNQKYWQTASVYDFYNYGINNNIHEIVEYSSGNNKIYNYINTVKTEEKYLTRFTYDFDNYNLFSSTSINFKLGSEIFSETVWILTPTSTVDLFTPAQFKEHIEDTYSNLECEILDTNYFQLNLTGVSDDIARSSYFSVFSDKNNPASIADLTFSASGPYASFLLNTKTENYLFQNTLSVYEYGVREYKINEGDILTNLSQTANEILENYKEAKERLRIKTRFLEGDLELFDRVTLNWRPDTDSPNVYDDTDYDDDAPTEVGNITWTSKDFWVTGYRHSWRANETEYSLREV